MNKDESIKILKKILEEAKNMTIEEYNKRFDELKLSDEKYFNGHLNETDDFKIITDKKILRKYKKNCRKGETQ